MGLKDLEIKSLVSKIKFIEDELDMVNSVHDELLNEFLKEANELAESRGLKPKDKDPLDKKVDDVVEEVIDYSDVTTDVKKLYRKIVTKTHPDKLIGVEDEIRGELTNLFEEAVEAFENKDLFCLMDIADKLKIKNLDINESHIPLIKNRAKELENILNKSKDSTVYVWYRASEEDRKKILDKYLTFMFF